MSTVTPEPSSVLLVETHSPSSCSPGSNFVHLARGLLEAGGVVRLHLIQNAVLWLQQDAQALTELRRQFEQQLRVSFDDVSLDLRGIAQHAAARLGEVWSIDTLIGEMAHRNVKTVWHS